MSFVDRRNAVRRNVLRREISNTPNRASIIERLEDRCLLSAVPVSSGSSVDQSSPVVATAPNGDYVVVWENGVFPNRDIHARRFNANGVAKDSSDIVISASIRDEYEPDVAMDANGDFVVVYTREDSSGDMDVYFRLFGADGQEELSEEKVNTYDSGYHQRSSAVAMEPDGRFVVAWVNEGGPIFSGDGSNLQYRRFNASGSARDSSESYLGDGTYYVDVAVNDAGNTAFVYTERISVSSNDGIDDNVQFRLLGNSANTIAQGSVHDSDTEKDQSVPRVAMIPNGEFVVAWEHEYSDNDTDIHAQRFSSTGTRVGSRITVAGSFSNENFPLVAMNDEIILVGYGLEVGNNDYRAYVRQYDSNTGSSIGSPIGFGEEDFHIYSGDVAIKPSGRSFVAVAENSDDDRVWAQVFGLPQSVGTDTIGLYQPDISLFHLKDSFTPGASDHYFAFGPGNAGWIPLAGDWNGDGVDTIGLYQPDISLFHLKDSFTPGASDHYFAFGPGNAGWIPLVGDWNGDGVDTIGLYQPDISLFHLKDSFTPGASDQYFAFGPGGAGWIPLAGDWNGDGVDTIGLYQPDISLFHLKDSFTPGASDQYFAFGPGNAGWIPLAGDWNADSVDTIGLYQPNISLYHLKDSFTPGASDQYFAFGPGNAGWVPLAGNWDGPGAPTLQTGGVAISDTLQSRIASSPSAKSAVVAPLSTGSDAGNQSSQVNSTSGGTADEIFDRDADADFEWDAVLVEMSSSSLQSSGSQPSERSDALSATGGELEEGVDQDILDAVADGLVEVGLF